MTSALRGEGVTSKADIVSNHSKGGCVNLRTRRGEGVKKSEIFADVINGSPNLFLGEEVWPKTVSALGVAHP